MALSAKLELRQSQALVITPQLQQAIKLLQLSNLELQAFLEQEIEQNPFVEWDDSTDDERFAADAEKLKNGASDGASDGLAGPPSAADSDAAREKSADDGVSDMFAEGLDVPIGAYEALSLRNAAGAATNSGGVWLEDHVSQQATLRDHLREQLRLSVSDPGHRLIGDYLIDQIDDAGYFKGATEEVAERLAAPLGRVEDMLSLVQRFDPAGVGARNLAECLTIQLQERNRYDPVIAKLVQNLEILAVHDFARLRRICAVDQDDLMDMVAEIRALNPKPGLQFGVARVDAVVPDILVYANPEGGWHVQLNQETLPRISINQRFYAHARRGARSEKDKTYLQGCMSTANWLARSLDQRKRTMLKVAREIVRQQAAFLTHGVCGLKPLSLRDIADKISMHESTVSRVTSNKYMQTPRGTLELKYFFTSAIGSACSGEMYSSEAVKHRIKQLIDAEAPRRVLSDDKIVDVLRDEGVEIARRTVAKYREMMRIPSSVQRRRKKETLYALAAR